MTAEAKTKTRGLGRGLNALFEDEENFESAHAPVKENSEAAAAAAPAVSRGRMMIAIDQLYRNEDQPRQTFNDDSIEELAESIAEHGILQPILVREKPSSKGRYEIVAGERRWRASQKAALHEVPVHIVELDDEETLEVALIENLQREDLNPVDEARGYHRLLTEHNRTQEEISKAISKSRSHVANMVRLLNLPPRVLEYLEKGVLTAGHARTLITANNAEALAKEMVAKGMNVREAEALVASSPSGGKRKLSRVSKDVDTVALEKDLMNILGMRVVIDTKNGKSGSLKIEFKSLDQLDDLIHRLSKFPKVILGE